MKVGRILLGLFVLGAASFLAFYFFTFPRPLPDYHRQNLAKFKGVWPAHGEAHLFFRNLEEVKERLGANVVAVSVNVCVRGDQIKPVVFGPPWLSFNQKRYVLNQIRTAHRAGLAVFLELGTVVPRCEMEVTQPSKFVTLFEPKVMEWAQLAEEYDVELFSPLNEPNLVLGKNAEKWTSQIASRVKTIYSGELVLKLADAVGDLPAEGYDYLAFDIFPHDPYDWERQVEEATQLLVDSVSRHGLKGGFWGEVGVPLKMQDNEDRRLLPAEPVSPAAQAKVFDTLFEKSWSQVKGAFVLGWSETGRATWSFTGQPAEQIISSWYKRPK